MKLILEFNNISKSDASIAGGKGASLGEMTRAGIPVPPGFVVLAGTFEKFLEETDLDVEVDAILDSVNHNEIHTVENASEKIQALILGADMPEDIEAEIENYFKKLDTKYVAVRSSATAEDSASAAWAGQLDSYLNTTEGTLLKNVKRCWASLFTPRAIFYRFEKELHKTKISVAVVVQKMVVSDVSGIAFSVHPVTEDRNQLIIEAGFGLGEAIVSGSITPDSYVVEKEPRRIIDKNVAEQARGIYRAEGGGDEWRDILSEKRSEQKLSDDQIFELSEIILRIESHYGFPCDIEWALEASTFYITQSRPITTLSISEEKKIVQKLTKFATRPVFPAIIFELQYRAATAGLKEWIGTGFSDCIIKCDGRKIDGYYLEAELSELKKPVLEFIASQKFQALMDLVAKFLDAYNDSIKSKQLDRSFQLLTKDLSYVVATIVCSIADKFWHDDLDQKMFDSVAQFRTQWDRVLRPPAETIEEYLKSKSLPFFSSLELINTPDWMNGGFVFSRGKFLRVPFEDFLCDNNLLIEEVVEIGETNEIKGAVAYAGTCRGIVRIIYGPQEFVQIKKGDILVTSMTKPSFAPIFPLLKAIITDEGGTLSHAAIISRELKIPCIISTKIATQVLKDGDMVEVDTEKGVVRKINAGINKEAGEEFKEAKRILKQYSVKPPLIRKGFHAKFYPIDFVQLLWKKWGDYSGFYYRLHISVWSNDYWYIYYIPEEFTALRDHYFAKIANDKKFLKKHHSDWSKSCNQLRKSITKLDKSLKNNEKFKEILDVYKNFANNYIYQYVLSAPPQEACGFQPEQWIIPEIESYTKKYDLSYQKTFALLTSPITHSFITQEEIELLKLARDYQSMETKGGSILENRVSLHQKRWFWIKNNYAEMDGLGVDFFKNRVEEYLNLTPLEVESKIDQLERGPGFVSEEKKQLLTTCAPTNKLRLYVEVNEMFAEMQDVRKSFVLIANYYHKKFLEMVAVETGQGLDNLWLYTYTELINAINDRNFISQNEISKRKQIIVEVESKDEQVVLSGDGAQFFHDHIHEEVTVTNRFSGLIAQAGVARGIVKLVFKSEDISKVEAGDILVSSMTRPEMTTAMNRAAAFVTDEGGITSHAAIISRELKKPCIIGTKIATQVLKDGDLVEVDADKGVVRIINSGKKVRIFEKLFTRQYSLITVEYWYKAEHDGLLTLTQGEFFFNPLFICDPKTGVSVYYDVNNPATDPKKLVEYFRNHKQRFWEIAEQYKKDCHKLEVLLEAATVGDAIKIFEIMSKDIWPVIAVTIILGADTENPDLKDIAKIAVQLRYDSDKLEVAVALKFKELLKERFPEDVSETDFISYEELLSGKFKDDELSKRKLGYIYFEGKIQKEKGVSIFADELDIVFRDTNANVNNSNEYDLQFSTSGYDILLLDTIFNNKDSYGEVDYIVLYADDITNAYLSPLGFIEARGIGKKLLDDDFFAELIKTSEWLDEELKKYNELTLTDKNIHSEWNKRLELNNKFGRLYRYYEPQFEQELEKCILGYISEDLLADVLTRSKFDEITEPLVRKYVERLDLMGKMKMRLHKDLERFATYAEFEKYVAEKNNLPINIVGAMRIKEFEEAINGHLVVDLEDLKKRLNGSVFVREGGVWNLYFGGKFLFWKNEIQNTIRKEIRGNSAYPGTAIGRVVIHLSWTDVTEIKEGEVLVTGMTNPQMIPMLQKASAIITDEGGITCHAAIIARELKKPCIVGTKSATQILKGGDLVEVDASNGTVKILERSKK